MSEAQAREMAEGYDLHPAWRLDNEQFGPADDGLILVGFTPNGLQLRIAWFADFRLD